MLTVLKGKITDRGGQGIPNAYVYLTDSKGALPNVSNADLKNFRKIANLDGEFSFAVTLPNVVTGGFFKTGTHIKATYTGLAPVFLPIDFNMPTTNGVGTINILMAPKTQQLDAVTVVAYKGKKECEQLGGVFNETNGMCTLPKKVAIAEQKKTQVVAEKSWWKKYKWGVIGGLGLLASVIIVIVVSKKDKKNKKK
jgi:hypothetical protein